MTIMNKLKILVEKVNSILKQMADFKRDTNEMKTVLYKRECFILLEKIYITFVIDNSIFGLSIMGRTFIDR